LVEFSARSRFPPWYFAISILAVISNLRRDQRRRFNTAQQTVPTQTGTTGGTEEATEARPDARRPRRRLNTPTPPRGGNPLRRRNKLSSLRLYAHGHRGHHEAVAVRILDRNAHRSGPRFRVLWWRRLGLEPYHALTQMAQNQWNLWTPEQDHRLRTLFEAGCSAMLVAAKLKRSLAATKARCGRLKISVKQKKPGLPVDGRPAVTTSGHRG
jgi:hypothetical protein